MVTENRLPVLALVIGYFLASAAMGEVAAVAWKVGDNIPDVKATSLEGIPVAFRPPEGKLLLILVDDLGKEGATDRTKAAITLFRRFHAKGLNAVGIMGGSSPDQLLRTAIRWQIPWPLLMPAKVDTRPSTPFDGLAPPISYVIDSQGKVVAVGLEGEKAHETIARLLNVSPNDVPMPKAPEPRTEASQNVAQIVQQAGVEARFTARLGTADERKDAEPCKKNLRLLSLALTEYREDHDGQMPRHLSDLFPKYLQDDQVLLCPKDPDLPEGFDDFADPNRKCSYLYEFAPGPRPRKIRQLEVYGDKVPMVRCMHHGRPLSLSYGGEIYFSELGWENEFPGDQTLESKEARIRRQLRIVGAALLKYKKDKGEMPERLADLVPRYLKDESSLTYPDTKRWFGYRFSPDAGGGKKGREMKLKEAQDPEYGAYVPVIRVKEVLDDGAVINLSYGGEIYESPERWEELFR